MPRALCLSSNSAGFCHFVNSPFMPQYVICGCARADSKAGRCMSPSAPPDFAMTWRCTFSKETTIAGGEMLTVCTWVAQITSKPAWPLRHTLAQRPVPPAAHAHYVEAFPREDDL